MGNCTIRKRVDIVGIPLEEVERFHALWNSLHTEVRTAEQFANWVKRVPSFGCSCASWLKDYLAELPYPEGTQIEVQRMYGWTLHNAVNKKLRDEGKDRPEFSWDEFEQKYPPGRIN